MKLIRRNHHPLFAGFDNLWDDFFTRDLVINEGVTNTLPAVNIKETDADFRLEVALPGVPKDQVHVEVNNNLLTLSSKVEDKQEETTEDGTYSRREFRYHSFKRSFTLPKTVDGEHINAQYENGILHVVLPKREEAKEKGPRLIEIA
ncbi:MAG: Hsp20/alpha crystallin family protein [Bacteroidota bacterium]